MFFWKKLCSCTYRTLQRICVYMKKNQSPRRLKNHNLICSDNLYIKIIIKFKVWNKNIGWTVVTHAFDPSTWEAEVGRFLSSRPAWSTEWVPRQPGLYRETLSRKNQKIIIIKSPYIVRGGTNILFSYVLCLFIKPLRQS